MSRALNATRQPSDPGASRTGTETREEIERARQASYVAFLHRHPWATDAYELGFSTGIREDQGIRDGDFSNVDVPVRVLDNDFRNPDLERYLERFRELQPEIGVLGDAFDAEDARRHIAAARELQQTTDRSLTLIVVPKCDAAFEILSDQPDIVLGFAMGYSDIHALDFTDPVDWRGQDVHLLGASPPKQNAVIQDLTQPTIGGDPPANIVGLDWNGIHKVAYKGETWTRDGWTSTDHLSIRGTVQRGLREIRAFWQERGVWPETTPIEEGEPAVRSPDDQVFAASGRQIDHREELEDAIVVEYDTGDTIAYQSEAERVYIEHRHGCPPEVVN